MGPTSTYRCAETVRNTAAADTSRQRGGGAMKRILVIGACAVMFSACGTTEQAKVSQTDLKCGFLGAAACAQLKPGAEGQIALRYVNSGANWTQYKKIMIQ